MVVPDMAQHGIIYSSLRSERSTGIKNNNDNTTIAAV